MKNIKVLGTGCANCKTVAKLIAAVAEEKGIASELEKVEEIREIMSFGILSTPGVVVEHVDFSRFELPVLCANEQEQQAHEAALADLDKACKGKTLWRQLQPA